MSPLPDRPANWWAVARTSGDAYLSSRIEVELLVAAERGWRFAELPALVI